MVRAAIAPPVLIVISARAAVCPAAGPAVRVETGGRSPILRQGLPMDNTWNGKPKGDVNRIPVIDLGLCTDCESCLAVSPNIFRRNPETGLIEVMELVFYPEEEVDQAISICPPDCIAWE